MSKKRNFNNDGDRRSAQPGAKRSSAVPIGMDPSKSSGSGDSQLALLGSAATTQTLLNNAVKAQKYRMIVDSIDRARMSTTHIQRIMQQSAQAYQERSNACLASSTQLGEEIQVLGAAKEFVLDTLRDLKQSGE